MATNITFPVSLCLLEWWFFVDSTVRTSWCVPKSICECAECHKQCICNSNFQCRDIGVERIEIILTEVLQGL